MTDDLSRLRELWSQPDEQAPDLDVLQGRLEGRRKRERWMARLEGVGILLGFIFTVGLLLRPAVSVTIVVLALFCWGVWGLALWSRWSVVRSEKRALSEPPATFIDAMRRHGEKRLRLMYLGRYVLVAGGVFFAVWTTWFVSDNLDVYTQEPWRAVLGVGGVIILYLLAIVLHRKEAHRIEADLDDLDELARRLGPEAQA